MLHLIKIRKQLKNELNLNRNFTRAEKRYIKTWIKMYKYNIDIILLAFHYTLNKDNPNFTYINCLLSDWYNRDFRTREDVIQWFNSIRNKK